MNTLLFFLSKILWLLLSPEFILWMLTGLSLVGLYLKKNKLAKLLLTITFCSLSLIALFPIDEWLAYPLENRFSNNPTLPNDIHGIIVLSGALNAQRSSFWNQSEFDGASERYISFNQLAKRFPQAKLVFTGGSGLITNQTLREADFSQKFFTASGFNQGQIIFERESRNTYENVINSKKLIQPQPDQKWVLVTSATHMPRSVGLFCQQQWPVIPYPVDHNTSPDNLFRLEFELADNLSFLSTVLHEWAGLLSHRISRKTSQLLPTAC